MHCFPCCLFHCIRLTTINNEFMSLYYLYIIYRQQLKFELKFLYLLIGYYCGPLKGTQHKRFTLIIYNGTSYNLKLVIFMVEGVFSRFEIVYKTVGILLVNGALKYYYYLLIRPYLSPLLETNQIKFTLLYNILSLCQH